MLATGQLERVGAGKGLGAGGAPECPRPVELAVRLGHDMLYVTPNRLHRGRRRSGGQHRLRSDDPVAALIERNQHAACERYLG